MKFESSSPVHSTSFVQAALYLLLSPAGAVFLGNLSDFNIITNILTSKNHLVVSMLMVQVNSLHACFRLKHLSNTRGLTNQYQDHMSRPKSWSGDQRTAVKHHHYVCSLHAFLSTELQFRTVCNLIFLMFCTC